MRWRLARSTGRLALAGLLALLVADILLVAIALRPDAADASSRSGLSARPASKSITRVPPVTSATSGQASMAMSPVKEVISAVDGQRAWRATLGSCQEGGASLSVTIDGGRTWTQRPTPVVAIGRIQPLAVSRGFFIGAQRGACTAGEYATANDGAGWHGPRPIEGGWSRSPNGDLRSVITPKLSDARPCGSSAVVDLARVSASRAIVICDDGQLVASSDGGATWPSLATVRGFLAVGAREAGGVTRVVVARIVEGCSGVEISTVAHGSAEAVSCVQASMKGVAGRVALSVVADGGWLAVGDATWRSDATFNRWHVVS